MPSITKILRVVADPNRLRILLLLKDEGLSVAELQDILSMGQSTISTHLSQLKQVDLVEDRRIGKSSLYRLAAQSMNESGASEGHDSSLSDRATNTLKGHPSSRSDTASGALKGHESTHSDTDPDASKGHDFSRAVSREKHPGALAPEGRFLNELLARAAAEIPEAASDQLAMRRALRKRQDKTRAFFDSVAGRLGKNYVPGKSWKSLAEALLRTMPRFVVADLGSGEGTFALMLAQQAAKVIAVDSSAKMIEVGRDLASHNGVQNVEFRLGDMEETPIADAEIDLVFFSQSLHHALHPERALHEAARILSPGGRVIILDLAKHRFEEARDIYADEWLGFSEAELESMLAKAGFSQIQVAVVDKELETPQFQTLLAVADKRN